MTKGTVAMVPPAPGEVMTGVVEVILAVYW